MFHSSCGSDVMSWGFDLRVCTSVSLDDNEGVHAMTEDQLDMMLSRTPPSSSSCRSSTRKTTYSMNSSFDTATLAEDLSFLCDCTTAYSAADSDEENLEAPPPCCHNSWDNLRAKKEYVTLRCRECSKQWKTTALRHNKCPCFTKDNCPEGAACTKVHVYRYKLSPKRRKMAAVAALGSQPQSPSQSQSSM